MLSVGANLHDARFFPFFLAVLSLLTAGNFFFEMVSNEWRTKPSVRNVYALTMFSFVSGLCALSIFPHQEPRFLIPLIAPIVLMNAHKLRFVIFLPMLGTKYKW